MEVEAERSEYNNAMYRTRFYGTISLQVSAASVISKKRDDHDNDRLSYVMRDFCKLQREYSRGWAKITELWVIIPLVNSSWQNTLMKSRQETTSKSTGSPTFHVPVLLHAATAKCHFWCSHQHQFSESSSKNLVLLMPCIPTVAICNQLQSLTAYAIWTAHVLHTLVSQRFDQSIMYVSCWSRMREKNKKTKNRIASVLLNNHHSDHVAFIESVIVGCEACTHWFICCDCPPLCVVKGLDPKAPRDRLHFDFEAAGLLAPRLRLDVARHHSELGSQVLILACHFRFGLLCRRDDARLHPKIRSR